MLHAFGMTKKLFKNYHDFDLAKWHWPHFSPFELSCKCGKHCNGEYFHDEDFLDALERLRKQLGPIFINSARRCPGHNKEAGGAKFSMHMREIAVDIKIAPFSRKAIYDASLMAGFKGLGFGVNFLHLDIGARRRWTYPGGLGLWTRALGFDPLKA